MIKSMTGFGKASLENETRHYQIEIRSVNHRFLDINIKMPRSISYLEETVKKTISSKIKRGKIDVSILYNNTGTEGKSININNEIAKIYIKELRKLAEEENLISDIPVTEISKMPDVLQIQKNEDNDLIKQEIIEVTNNALEKLIDMRSIEGEKIAKDLLKRVKYIEQKNQEILKLSTGLIEEYVVKLEKRLNKNLKTTQIDKALLAQEVVIYADKSSIEEETTRLKSHVFQIKNLLDSNEVVGKKLDFIIQEMNRETNTIGSKSNSLEITNSVIDMKTQIEDMREQVQNIE